ncbi:TPA: hypothetical protein DDW35_03770 [Candidatus Sumerlaeota bacterium]|jgi:ribosomal protein L11 methyltransferase|nr:hypothetical protein [Candidatus Sumerlaeota bacterium]
MSENPTTWPAFFVQAPEALFEEVEETLLVELDPGDLLGISRETWRDPRFEPTHREIETGILAIYLAPEVDVEMCAHQISNALGADFPDEWAQGLIEVRPSEIPDADWATLWRDYFKPLRITENLIVVPAWWPLEDALNYLTGKNAGPVLPDAIPLFIQPGQAFGSGTHGTTQLALRMLERNLKPDHAVLDFGAGSGILCFAAAALGAGKTLGVEIDPVCVSNYEENLELNTQAIMRARTVLTGCVANLPAMDYRIGSTDAVGSEEFDVIVCNVLYSRIKDHLPALLKCLRPGGLFLFSGFLITEFAEAQAELELLGMTIYNQSSQDEWGALEGRKK